jgi:hypothetical protein
MLVIFPSPILKLQHAPLPPKVLRARECAPTPYSCVVFISNSHLESIKESGGASSLGSVKVHSLTLSYTLGT